MTSGNEFQNLIEKVNDISKENGTLEIIQLNDRRYTNPKSQEGNDSDGAQSGNAQSEKLHKNKVTMVEQQLANRTSTASRDMLPPRTRGTKHESTKKTVPFGD